MKFHFLVCMAFAALASGAIPFFLERGGSTAKYKKSTEFKNYYKKSCKGVPHIMHTYDHVSPKLNNI